MVALLRHLQSTEKNWLCPEGPASQPSDHLEQYGILSRSCTEEQTPFSYQQSPRAGHQFPKDCSWCQCSLVQRWHLDRWMEIDKEM